MKRYVANSCKLYTNYKFKVTFNEKVFYLATPTRLKDFMLGIGMGMINLPVKINSRVFFPHDWGNVTLRHLDQLTVQFPERKSDSM